MSNDGSRETNGPPSDGVGGSPLSGVRVLDFGTAWAGPHATETLALLGADVVKIESRKRLDLFRTMAGMETTPGFNDINLSKRSLCIDLSREDGRGLARRLTAVADIAVDNYRPGVMERLGLDYQSLSVINPKIICLSVSAFGATGPEASRAGYAAIFCAMGGLAHLTGYPDWEPALVRSPMDLTVANASAAAAVAALWDRDETGVGCFVDMSASDVVTNLIPGAVAAWDLEGVDLNRQGNASSSGHLQEVFPACGEDSWVAVSVWNDEQRESLADFVGESDAKSQLRSWIATRTAPEAADALQRAGVPAVPTMSPIDIIGDQHLQERGVFERLHHPMQGDVLALGRVWRTSSGPQSITRAPLLGEHSREVLGEWLNLTDVEIDHLRDAGVLE